MFSSLVKSGIDLENLLIDLLGENFTDNWKIKRPKLKNHNLKIKGVIIASKIDNKLIGYLLEKDINLVLLVDSYIPNYILNELLEIIYKNNIYIFEIGIKWLYEYSLGNKIITKIFNGEEFLVWREKTILNHCLISFNKYITLKISLERFPESIKWVHPLINKPFENININNLLIIDSFDRFENILKYQPSVIIIHEINSDLIDFCWKNKIILVWIHKTDFLNEISRELYYKLSNLKLISNVDLFINKVNSPLKMD